MTPSTPSTHDVFLSYAHDDRARALAVIAALSREGYRVWSDKDIPAGDNFVRTIEAALQSAKCVVVLWSPRSVSRDWVLEEASLAKELGKLIPATIETAVIPLSFRLSQASDLRTWKGQQDHPGWEDLLAGVRRFAGRPLSTAPVSKPTPAAEPIAPPRPAPPRPLPDPPAVVREPGPLSRRRSPATLAIIGGLIAAGVGIGVVSQWPDPPAVVKKEEPKQPDVKAVEPPKKVTGQVQPPPDPKPQVAAIRTPSPPALGPTGLKTGTTRVNDRDRLTYVRINPGTFRMGCSPGDDNCEDDESPAHDVRITRGFWMGATEVTQEAYELVTRKNPSHFKGPKRPVEQVSWEDANGYCSAVGLRLPTEAEWEFAARAGTTGSRYGPLDAVAWHSGNSRATHDVGTKQPNAWGLSDMLGNVREWVADWYDEGYYKSRVGQDPAGPSSGKFRVLRGGSWYLNPVNVRASFRSSSCRRTGTTISGSGVPGNCVKCFVF